MILGLLKERCTLFWSNLKINNMSKDKLNISGLIFNQSFKKQKITGLLFFWIFFELPFTAIYFHKEYFRSTSQYRTSLTIDLSITLFIVTGVLFELLPGVKKKFSWLPGLVLISIVLFSGIQYFFSFF